MRETDRKKNGMGFPKLYYPEVYLLEGGYKAFFEKFSVRFNDTLLVGLPQYIVCRYVMT